MVKLPDELSGEIAGTLIPSAVIRTPLTFEDGLTKPKRLIIVAVDDDQDEVLYVKTTSKNLHLYHNGNPALRGHFIYLKAKEVPIFELDTAIDFRRIGAFRISALRGRHRQGELMFMGNMPPDLMADIYQCIRGAQQIERQLKRKILDGIT